MRFWKRIKELWALDLDSLHESNAKLISMIEDRDTEIRAMSGEIKTLKNDLNQKVASVRKEFRPYDKRIELNAYVISKTDGKIEELRDDINVSLEKIQENFNYLSDGRI